MCYQRMFTALILFGKPVDEDDFDRYCEQEHYRLIAQLPNLQDVRISKVVGAVEGVSPYYLALELSFDSAQALQDSLNSDIGQAMAQDYKCFASGGVNVLVCHLDARSLTSL